MPPVSDSRTFDLMPVVTPWRCMQVEAHAALRGGQETHAAVTSRLDGGTDGLLRPVTRSLHLANFPSLHSGSTNNRSEPIRDFHLFLSFSRLLLDRISSF